jgi:HEAT repeat protein
MLNRSRITIALLALFISGSALAQAEAPRTDAEELKLAALEALLSAPPERALPLVTKVLDGDHSDVVKARALFVLSQIDAPEAQQRLADMVRTSSGKLQREAIRMVGIGGDPEALASLAEIYNTGDQNARRAVLEAYVISDNVEGIYNIAVNAQSDEDFSHAAEMLAALGAKEELRKLREVRGVTPFLIHAYAVSGDVEALRELAMDSSDPERQARAIEALGITGEDNIGPILVEIYEGTDDRRVRHAAMNGLMIAGEDQALLQLYRSTDSVEDKRHLLQMLMATDSDLVMEVIDEALEGGL